MKFLSLDKLSFLGPHRYVGHGEFTFDCPKCGVGRKKFHFGVNVKKHVYNCFRCGFSGHLDSLLGQNQGYGSRIGGNGLTEQARPPSVEIKDFHEFSRVESAISAHSRDMETFIRDRCGFKQAYEYGFGYSTNRRFLNRIIIPIYEDEELIYWVARSIYKELEPKEISPHKEEVRVKRTEVVFGLDELDCPLTIIVVEGIFDALRLQRLGHQCVSTLGAYVSPEQIGKIISTEPDRIIFLADGDVAGYQNYAKAGKACHKRFKGDVDLFHCPDGTDPEDLTDDQLDDLLGEGV